MLDGFHQILDCLWPCDSSMLRGFLFVLNVHTACFHVFPALSPGFVDRVVFQEICHERSRAEWTFRRRNKRLEKKKNVRLWFCHRTNGPVQLLFFQNYLNWTLDISGKTWEKQGKTISDLERTEYILHVSPRFVSRCSQCLTVSAKVEGKQREIEIKRRGLRFCLEVTGYLKCSGSNDLYQKNIGNNYNCQCCGWV